MLRKLLERYKGLEVKNQQYLNVLLVLIVLLCVVGGIIYHLSDNQGSLKKTNEESQDRVTRIESLASKTDPQVVWRHRTQEEIEKLANQMDELKKIIARDLIEKEKQKASVIDEKDQLKEEIELLKETLAYMRQGKWDNNIRSENLREGLSDEQGEAKGIRRISFALEALEDLNIKNIKDTIPAGAFAKGIILGGVDASTNVNSQSDPRPMLIRLVDAGTLPRRFKSDLKDCHIVASSYGDLSSERVYARLEKLSCVERVSGEIVETEVGGYIAGDDAKAGIRGKVIEKGRKYLNNSVVGGVLQGVAGMLSPQNNSVVSPFGAFFEKQSMSSRFGQGAASGVSGSMDRLSQYYISRAETITPVIEVSGGRMVDVVFTEGAKIGTHLVRKKLEAKRTRQEIRARKQGGDNLIDFGGDND